MYTHWIDPDKGCETTIDAVIDKMIKLREGHQKNPHEQQEQQRLLMSLMTDSAMSAVLHLLEHLLFRSPIRLFPLALP